MVPASPSPQQWFVENAARRLGPYTLDQLKTALNAGKVTPQTTLITVETAPGGIEKRLTLGEALQEFQNTENAGPRDATMTLFDALQATKNIQRERHSIQHAPQMTVIGSSGSERSFSPRLIVALGITLIGTLLIWAGANRWSNSVPLASTTGTGTKGNTPAALAPRTLTPQPTAPLSVTAPKPVTPPSRPTAPVQQAFPRSFGANPVTTGNSGVSSANDEKEKERERERDREYEREREREKRRQMEAWGDKRSGNEQPAGIPEDPEASRALKETNLRGLPGNDNR